MALVILLQTTTERAFHAQSSRYPRIFPVRVSRTDMFCPLCPIPFFLTFLTSLLYITSGPGTVAATARTAPEQLQANEWIPVSLLHIFPLGLAWERVVSWLAFSLGEGGPDDTCVDSGYHRFASGGVLME